MSTTTRTVIASSFSSEDFDAIERTLQGRQKVVVSKGTLAKVSRQHSSILRQLVLDVANNQAGLQKLQQDWSLVTDLQERVGSLESQLADAQETIRQHQEILDKQSDILEYGKRMDAIVANLEAIMNENQTRDELLQKQRSDHDDLDTRVTTAEVETKKFRTGLTTGATEISDKCVNVEVDRARLNEVMMKRKKMLARLDQTLFECKEDLERKGDLELVKEAMDGIANQERELVNVKSSLLAVGIDVDGGDDGRPGGALVEMANNIKQQRVQLDEATTSCERLEKQMLDKADVRGVDEKIEQRYQEVVDHLQKAISAAADDEVEFKKVATELQDTVKQLMNTKADRQDLLEMKEKILADSKLNNQLSEIRSSVDSKIDRVEAQDLIAQKPDKKDIMQDVKRAMAGLASRQVDSGPDSGWATRSPTPGSRGGPRPMTSDGLKGNKTLLCISCNSQLTHPTTDRPNSSPAIAQAAYARNAAEQHARGDTGVDLRNAPTLGPGGPALGGGFQVRIPDSRGSSRQSARMLPKLQSRPGTGASRIIIGANGIVYQAADAAYSQHPGGGSYHSTTMAGAPAAALRHAQSLPPTAFADTMPGTEASGYEHPETMDLPEDARLTPPPRQRNSRFAPPELSPDVDTSLVKPVSVKSHTPNF